MICHRFNLVSLVAQQVRSVIKANKWPSTFTLNHCLLIEGLQEGSGAVLWRYGRSQLLKLPNVMAFFSWNGLQNQSQISVVTCLTKPASTAHAPFRNFRKQDRPLSTPANERPWRYYSTWRNYSLFLKCWSVERTPNSLWHNKHNI